MTDEQLEEYKKFAAWVNALSDEEIFENYFKKGKCPGRPDLLKGVPLGMYHCEICGIMVLASVEHPAIVWHGDFKNGWADYTYLE